MTAPMAVRLDWGKLHLGGPTGRGYKAICGRLVQQTDDGPDLVVYWGRRDVARAWGNEVQCLDCARKLRQKYGRH